MSSKIVLAAVLIGSLASVASFGQNRSQAATPVAGPTESADRVSLPKGQTWLGTVRLPVSVLADGKTLPAGTYRVRLTGEEAKEDAVGQLETLERWIEFVQGNQVKGRALAPVVPSGAVKEVTSRTPPARGRVRVERLREDKYYRLWFNHRGDQILVHLPIA